LVEWYLPSLRICIGRFVLCGFRSVADSLGCFVYFFLYFRDKRYVFAAALCLVFMVRCCRAIVMLEIV